jgi:hypothetical protein
VGVSSAEEPISNHGRHREVAIAFLVERVLQLTVDDGIGGLMMPEMPVDLPWVKDYNAIKGAERPDGRGASTWRTGVSSPPTRATGGSEVPWSPWTPPA